jgi:hypothetical protein
MFRKAVCLVVLMFLFVLVSSSMAQTEDDIIAKYLKKTEKKHKNKIGYMSFYGSYGKLPGDGDYLKFVGYANNGIDPGGPIEGIWRSKQFGGEFGIMVTPYASVNFGFEYWLKMGNSSTGDYTFTINPAGTYNDYTVRSEIKVYGFTGGINYFPLNPPDREGLVHSVSAHIGAGIGYYLARWELWDSADAFNLSTSSTEPNVDAFDGSTLGFSIWAGADYPTGFYGLLVGADVKYQYVNFENLHTYNGLGEELYVSYDGAETGRVDIDVSGFRAQLAIKRYFAW